MHECNSTEYFVSKHRKCRFIVHVLYLNKNKTFSFGLNIKYDVNNVGMPGCLIQQDNNNNQKQKINQK